MIGQAAALRRWPGIAIGSSTKETPRSAGSPVTLRGVAEGMQPQAVAVIWLSAHSRLNAALGDPSSYGCLVFCRIRSLSMQLNVLLACLARMFMRMNRMPMRYMSVVSSRFVVTFAYMFCRGAVMFSSFFVVLRRLFVQFLQLFHDQILSEYWYAQCVTLVAPSPKLQQQHGGFMTAANLHRASCSTRRIYSIALLRSPTLERTPGSGSSAKRRVMSLSIDVVS